MYMRVSEDRKGVSVWVTGLHMCLCLLWQTGDLPRGVFLLFQVWDTEDKKWS